jgi:hypothetical protein
MHRGTQFHAICIPPWEHRRVPRPHISVESHMKIDHTNLSSHPHIIRARVSSQLETHIARGSHPFTHARDLKRRQSHQARREIHIKRATVSVLQHHHPPSFFFLKLKSSSKGSQWQRADSSQHSDVVWGIAARVSFLISR